MPQKYEIFKGDKVYIVTDSDADSYDSHIVIPCEVDDFPGFDHLEELLSQYSEKTGIVLLAEKPGELMQRFLTEFTQISAAGGLVVDVHSGRVLMIHRKGKWDLPKGKLEQNEFMRQAALREVREECGIQDLKILRTIRPTFHIYEEDDKRILKTTYWYEMECRDPENASPQEEEGISHLEWIEQNELKTYIRDTYPNIKIILALYASQQRDFDGLSPS